MVVVVVIVDVVVSVIVVVGGSSSVPPLPPQPLKVAAMTIPTAASATKSVLRGLTLLPFIVVSCKTNP